MSNHLPTGDVDAVAIGGGGGVLEVTWPACVALGFKTVLVETIYGRGGSSRRIGDWLRPTYGATLAPGNYAAAFERILSTKMLTPILEYRIPRDDGRPLSAIIEDQLRVELSSSLLSPLACRLRDRLIAFARDWDRSSQESPYLRGFPLAEHSVRNLIVLWHWLDRFEIYQGRNRVAEDRMDAAVAALHEFYSCRDDALVLPVSIEPGTLVARYRDPVPRRALEKAGLEASCLADDPHMVTDQHAINLLRHSNIVDFDLWGASTPGGCRSRPKAYAPVLTALENCNLILVGGGSFFTSLLACLAVEGVVETMIGRPDVPRVLFINPYHLEQTRHMGVLDFVRFVETLADRVLRSESKRKSHQKIRFETIFSDIIVGDPCGDSRLLRLLDQRGSDGEARGAICLAPHEFDRLKARGIRVHCGPYMTPQRKRLKRPGNDYIEIAGYDPLKIATVLARIQGNQVTPKRQLMGELNMGRMQEIKQIGNAPTEWAKDKTPRQIREFMESLTSDAEVVEQIVGKPIEDWPPQCYTDCPILGPAGDFVFVAPFLLCAHADWPHGAVQIACITPDRSEILIGLRPDRRYNGRIEMPGAGHGPDLQDYLQRACQELPDKPSITDFPYEEVSRRAAQRELVEETGLYVPLSDLIFQGSYWWRPSLLLEDIPAEFAKPNHELRGVFATFIDKDEANEAVKREKGWEPEDWPNDRPLDKDRVSDQYHEKINEGRRGEVLALYWVPRSRIGEAFGQSRNEVEAWKLPEASRKSPWGFDEFAKKLAPRIPEDSWFFCASGLLLSLVVAARERVE